MIANEQTEKPANIIAGFWIRVAADAIDFMFLWLLALLLSLFMEGWFLKLGENGIWFGFLISLAYFVPTQSNFGNGQSPGKRLLRIQIVRVDGQPLSLAKSFSRYLAIAIVTYTALFTGIVTLAVGSKWATLVDSIMGTLWIIGFVGCYLLIPLHPLKRGLHDLIAGSIVVYRDRFNASTIAALNDPAKTRKAYVILGGINALTIALGVWAALTVLKHAPFAAMREIQAKLESTGKFRLTSVTDNTSTNNSGTTRSIIVQTHVDGPFNQTTRNLQASYDLAFQTIREGLPSNSSYNNLRVGLRMGYNLGIRKHYVTLFQDENPNKIGERRDAGSRINF